MKILGLFGVVAVLAACNFQPAKIFSDYTRIEVREVGRSLHCKAASADAEARLFSDLSALQRWLDGRAVKVSATQPWAEAPYAIIEMGQRPTGGYGLAVSRAAVLRGELLILSATFVSPGADAMVSQALTSPCAIVQLPPGNYRIVEIQDQTGVVRATGTAADAAP